jgi:hypothetical protein
VRERERPRGGLRRNEEGKERSRARPEKERKSGPERSSPRQFSLNRLGRHCRPPWQQRDLRENNFSLLH